MNIDIDKHQYMCVRHKDTDKDPIHIVAIVLGWMVRYGMLSTQHLIQ